MERLSSREMRRTLNSLLEVAMCPVCHNSLEPTTVLCINGHPTCASCCRDLQSCPLCRDVFSDVKPTGFIQQVLLSLPHPCKFQGCNYFVKSKDDHEKYCGWRPAECRLAPCQWSGPGLHIIQHLRDDHHEAYQTMSNPELNRVGIPFNPRENGSIFLPIFICEHFFWGEMKNEIQAEKLSVIIHIVPNSKTSAVFYAHVKLKSKKECYGADLKLNLDPEVDPYKNNCIIIPTSILHKFTDDKSQLMYNFYIAKKKWESTCNIVKLKFEKLKQ